MNAHTPGPWVVETGRPLMVVAEKGGFAVLVSEVGRLPTVRDVANACLVAAAPELLSSLKELLSYCSQLELIVYPKDDVDTHRAVAHAQEAIDKAESQ